ncbi:AAA family ATPase, partial [Brachyspira hampsonii]
MSENIKYPTLYVKNFAKIKEAKIELSPFTLFIGDNNSGKSYLMTLVYGLIKYTAI